MNSRVLWSEKYKPKTLRRVTGNQEAVRKILNWLRMWGKEAPRKRAVLLCGPAGTGKTVVVEAIANDYGCELIETNASDFRRGEQIERQISRCLGHQTLDHGLYESKVRGRMILFDEVDGICGGEDRGGIGAIIKVIRKADCPVFLTVNDAWHPKLKTLRQHCVLVDFHRIQELTIVSYLREICRAEKIEVSEDALESIALNADGDMRAAVNDLQVLAMGRRALTANDVSVYVRDEQVQTFDALVRFFTAKTWVDAKKAMDESTIGYEKMMLCIHESLPYQFKDPEDLARAYELLSRADIFLRRAKSGQAWKLLKYVFDLMAGIPFLREHGYPTKRVLFSQKLKLMSSTGARRRLEKEIGLLIGSKCHVSSRVAIRKYLPYLRVIFSRNAKVAAGLSEWFGMRENMIQHLAGENAGSVLSLVK
ncbi:MAG: replication factor C large subunit [Candidatus Bathyarchaeota archaeon]|nr:replication factor C large subunit [Candidatus Bathyarchaeota archaeon]